MGQWMLCCWDVWEGRQLSNVDPSSYVETGLICYLFTYSFDKAFFRYLR